MTNPNFEFKQLLGAYRAGIITDETFECELGAMESGNGNGKAGHAFRAMSKSFPSENAGVAAMLDRFHAARCQSLTTINRSAQGG